jgi:RimJ/RimL family protein N-acetyltransferase
MITPVSITTESLTLREFTREDVGKVFQMSREKGIQEWIPDQVYQSKAQATEVIEYLLKQYRAGISPKEAPIVLGIVLQSDRDLIGHVGLSPIAGGEVEIGYAIESSRQGKGYATEAVRAMVQWGLSRFGLPCILGIVSVENKESCRVLEKAGFTLYQEKTGSLHRRQTRIRTYRHVRNA